jgi:lipoyl-dependent peroxiredoxin
MAEITRTSQATWFGDLRSGKGQIISESGEIKNQQYSYATRFEETRGTNPEELIAAAHAGCYAMAFSGHLAKKGYRPESIEVRAVCFLESIPSGGHQITRMSLDILGKVPDIDEETFTQLAHEADKNCPVSNLLRSGLEIQIEPALVNTMESQQK